MGLKRPLGLGKTKKANKEAQGSSAKRQRTSKDADEADIVDADQAAVTTEDWEDLKELSGRAQKAFDGDVVSALPLLRGIIHECDRISRLCPDPSTLYSNPDTTSTLDPTTAFYALYADALVHVGIIIRDGGSELAAEGEPDSAPPYFEAALDIIENGVKSAPKRQNEVDWKLEYVWARALVFLADWKASVAREEAEEGDADTAVKNAKPSPTSLPERRMPESTPHELIQLASVHYRNALDNLPAPVQSGSPNKSSSSLKPAGEDSEDVGPIPPPSRAEVCCTVGAAVFDVAEALLSPAERHEWFTWAEDVLAQGEKDILNSTTTKWAYVIAKTRGKCWLSTWSTGLGEDFEEDPNVADRPEAEEARKGLEIAITQFDRARSLMETTPPTAPQNKMEEGIEEEKEELGNLLSEALIFLANLTNDEGKREELFERAKAEGADLSDGEDEDEE